MSMSARGRPRAGWISVAAFLAALTLTGAFGATVSAGPGNPCPSASCLLEFVFGPNTTKTGNIIMSGYNSTGSFIQVEIVDPDTGDRVDSNAQVRLIPGDNLSASALSGAGPVTAVAGLATFPNVRISVAGQYTLFARSSAASVDEESGQFLVSDLVTQCTTPSCSFTQAKGKTSYTITPKQGTDGARYVSTIDLTGVTISCDFPPFNYPDSRQPNTLFFIYDDDNVDSPKTAKIVIDKTHVQITPENGASKYRICYASPDQFDDRTGGPAKLDTALTAYFGVDWYVGLLADCSSSKPPVEEMPCSFGFTGSGAGNRIGTAALPPGDPSIR